MKIMFYNIAYGTGLNGNWKQYILWSWRFFWLPLRTFAKIADTMKKAKPDVICLVEVDGGSFRNRFQCQARQLAAKLLFPFFYSQTKYRRWSMWWFMTMVRRQNNAVLSKKPGQIKRYELDNGMDKLVLEYVVEGLSIFTVHLAVLSERVRRNQMRQLAEILKKCPRPHVVCGDFNIHNGLDELKEFIRSTGLRRLIKKPTFPSLSPTRYLDLFFASPGLEIKRAGIIKVPYSDHLPVWVEIA